MSQQPPIGEVVKELQSDLARKWTRHGSDIDKYWRSLDPKKRVKCVKAGAMDGAVLKHPMDRSLGNVYKFMPEYNLRDLAANPDFLLDILKHRATCSPQEQYARGINGQPGDHGLIVEMMETRNLAHVEPFTDRYTLFMDGERYGFSFEITRPEYKASMLASLAPAIQAALCVPQSVGELVLTRQMYLLQALNVLIMDILEEGSTTRAQSKPAKNTDRDAEMLANAVSTLAVDKRKVKLSLPSLVATARDQKASLEEQLELLTTEPVVLAHSVNHFYFSRPELVPDEKGRMLPAMGDKYISGAVFDAMHRSVRSVAIWDYITRLLDLLTSTKDKAYRTIILQELANVCHLEYNRAQAAFRVQVQTGSGLQSKAFHRLSNAVDKAGRARVVLKTKPEDLTLTNPQLHYLLRLCQPETTPPKAIEWIKKLADLHDSHSAERAHLHASETEALCDLAVIVAFIHDLSPVVGMPSLSRKKNQTFVSRAAALDAELASPALDLLAFASPIDNLLEPGMAAAALRALDAFVIAEAGSTLGFLYQDLIDDCLAHLLDAARVTAPPQPQPVALLPEQPAAARVEHRKQKEKTRPSSGTSPTTRYPIVPPTDSTPAEPASSTSPTFEVSAAAAQVFSTLFAKGGEARGGGGLSWASFCAAMAELGFAVAPTFGSVFTFYPPATLAEGGAITLHRPHGVEFERYAALKVRRRLERRYGWGEGTFLVG